jgi:hypothetical protein
MANVLVAPRVMAEPSRRPAATILELPPLLPVSEWLTEIDFAATSRAGRMSHRRGATIAVTQSDIT